MMYELYIANKNYSSWSLRAWVLMRELGIAFSERMVFFGDADAWESLRRLGASGLVPCLVDGEQVIWDSLAISEYLAETHERVWPADRSARAWARSAAAEMHSGFGELRERCSMSCGVRVRLHAVGEALQRDLQRVAELWKTGLQRFGGPFLAGETFTVVDAFFAPVAFRLQSYGLTQTAYGFADTQPAGAYAARLLALPSMRMWYAQALSETQRDEPHERQLSLAGTLLQDLRQAS